MFIGVLWVSKQWGKIVSGQAITYPLSFTVFCHPVLSVEYASDNISAAYWAIKTTSLSGFTRALGNLNGHYIVAGK